MKGFAVEVYNGQLTATSFDVFTSNHQGSSRLFELEAVFGCCWSG